LQHLKQSPQIPLFGTKILVEIFPLCPTLVHCEQNISPLPYSCALRAGGSYNYLLVNGVRRLTGREMLRLQGFPDSFKINVPYSQVRKIAGNSVTIPVIKAIAGEMIKALENKQKAFNLTQLNLFENEYTNRKAIAG